MRLRHTGIKCQMKRNTGQGVCPSDKVLRKYVAVKVLHYGSTWYSSRTRGLIGR